MELLAKWRAKGGVFLIGYSAFRNLSLGKNVKERNMAREMCSALQVFLPYPFNSICALNHSRLTMNLDMDT